MNNRVEPVLANAQRGTGSGQRSFTVYIVSKYNIAFYTGFNLQNSFRSQKLGTIKHVLQRQKLKVWLFGDISDEKIFLGILR